MCLREMGRVISELLYYLSLIDFMPNLKPQKHVPQFSLIVKTHTLVVTKYP